MNCRICFFVPFLAVLLAMPIFGNAVGQENTSIFVEEETKSDDSGETSPLKEVDPILKSNPKIAAAYKTWQDKIGEITDRYVKAMRTLSDREKTKGDLDSAKYYERLVDSAETRHKSPCLLFERLPQKAANLLADMNKAKSKANKTYMAIVEREISEAVRGKDLDKAKNIEAFLLSSFLPESMRENASEAVRLENKIYLFADLEKTWQEAYDWSRQRHGDLISVGGMTEQLFLFNYLVRLDKLRYSWTGGVKTDRTWSWTDGQPFSFQFWAPGQPSGSHTETRIAFAFKGNASWDDAVPNVARPFLVQWALY